MRYTIVLIMLLRANSSIAGSGDTGAFSALNAQRIRTDITGMRVLAGWGLLNTVEGIAGTATAEQDEWKHFHQMNAAWGVINSGIAGLGYLGARRELKKQYSRAEALHRYEATKRLYLLNAGLDGLYISTGVFLAAHAKHTGDADLYRGFGRSLILQGAGLLLFDATMFTAHHHKDKGWYRALQGLCITGNGIGWRYAIR
jgi:hypothetical protein